MTELYFYENIRTIKMKIINDFIKSAESIENPDKKIEIYYKALEFSEKYEVDSYSLLEVHLQLIIIFLNKDQYSKATEYIQRGKKYCNEAHELSYFVLQEANVHYYNNRLYDARKVILQFLREYKELFFANLLNLLAEIHQADNKTNKAIFYLNKIISLYSEEYDDFIDIEMAYFSLIDLYRKNLEIEKANIYLEDAKEILSPFNYNFLKFNLLVKRENYNDASLLLPKLENQIKSSPDLIPVFTGITLELFRQTNDLMGFKKYLKKSLLLNKNDTGTMWLILDQAGNFYEKRNEYRKSLRFYKLASHYLDRNREYSSYDSKDRIDFFKDKYHYLLSYTLYAYKLNNFVDALCFFELSKSSSLRDDISLSPLKYQQTKEYL